MIWCLMHHGRFTFLRLEESGRGRVSLFGVWCRKVRWRSERSGMIKVILEGRLVQERLYPSKCVRAIAVSHMRTSKMWFRWLVKHMICIFGSGLQPRHKYSGTEGKHKPTMIGSINLWICRTRDMSSAIALNPWQHWSGRYELHIYPSSPWKRTIFWGRSGSSKWRSKSILIADTSAPKINSLVICKSRSRGSNLPKRQKG